MLIGVPREIASGERRVALVPEVVPQLSRAGHRVVIERDAGLRAGFTDDSYRASGCEIVDSSPDIYSTAQMVLKVQRPGRDESSGEAELDMMREGTVLI
jgi:alanine dehydrogenase